MTAHDDRQSPGRRWSIVTSPALSGQAGRVLIVDDDPDMCETLTVHLTRRGFETESRASGAEALVLVEAQDFDVILTDLNMHEMTGITLCERIVVLRPGLPVIVTTGFGSAEVRVAALDAGAFEVLIKPFDLERLRCTLERAVLAAARSARTP